MGDANQTPVVQIPAETAKPQVTVREAVYGAILHGLVFSVLWLTFVHVVPSVSRHYVNWGVYLPGKAEVVAKIADTLVRIWYLGPLLVFGLTCVDGIAYYRIGNRYGRKWARGWSYLVIVIIWVAVLGTLDALYFPLYRPHGMGKP